MASATSTEPSTKAEKAENDSVAMCLSIIANTPEKPDWAQVAADCGLSIGAVQKRFQRLRAKYGGTKATTNADAGVNKEAETSVGDEATTPVKKQKTSKKGVATKKPQKSKTEDEDKAEHSAEESTKAKGDDARVKGKKRKAKDIEA